MSVRMSRGLPGRRSGRTRRSLVAHPEIEAVAVDLDDVRKGESRVVHVVGVSHRGRFLALVGADEACLGQDVTLRGGGDLGVGRMLPRLYRLIEREQPEDVVMCRIPGWGRGPEITRRAESVRAAGRFGRVLTLGQPSPGRIQAEHHPVHEASPYRRVRIIDEQQQLAGAVGDAVPHQRR
jgi:hypothetical protein